MSEDILECKPSWGPFKLNVNALWRRLGGRPAGSADGVADRFLKVFADHGVSQSQIPRFLPELSLATLSTRQTLLAALTPSLLNTTARLFGLQRAWLEGVTDRVYRTKHCYKQPQVLFELLHALPFKRGEFQVRALTSTKSLNFRSGLNQLLALVVVEKLADVEDVEEIWDIERYHIFDDSWNWAYPPCRIQLKAMVRIIDQLGHQPVPLFQVKPAELDAVLAGRWVPRHFVHHCLLSEPSLEDYTCSKSEHAQAKEIEELPSVLDYTEKLQLATVWAKARDR